MTIPADTSGMTQSLCKAFEILACFSPETPQLRVSDFMKRLDITQSNISRILKTMTAYGYLVWDEETGYYQLGNQIITLSSVVLNSIELRRQALPELFLLEQNYDVGANLAIRQENRIVSSGSCRQSHFPQNVYDDWLYQPAPLYSYR